jgi:uncharacterized protein
MEIEVRTFEGESLEIETRDGEPKAFTGYAIVFNQRSQNLGGFTEIIDANALNGADITDVLGVFNHDVNFILGRSTAGTLTLKADDKGLKYEIAYDAADPDHVKLMRKITRGDVRGSSFKFTVASRGDEWQENQETGAVTRTIKSIGKLYDVGPVVSPAYTQTTAARRSLADWIGGKNNEGKKLKIKLLTYL